MSALVNSSLNYQGTPKKRGFFAAETLFNRYLLRDR